VRREKGKRLRQIAERRRVRVGGGDVWMEGVWWMWKEERGELKDDRGRC